MDRVRGSIAIRNEHEPTHEFEFMMNCSWFMVYKLRLKAGPPAPTFQKIVLVCAGDISR